MITLTIKKAEKILKNLSAKDIVLNKNSELIEEIDFY